MGANERKPDRAGELSWDEADELDLIPDVAVVDDTAPAAKASPAWVDESPDDEGWMIAGD